MEKLGEVLKIFIEKHLMPSVICIAGSIITLLFISDSSWILLKIGKILFLCLAFCIYFIIVQLITNLYITFTTKSYRSNSREKQKKEELEKLIEYVNGFVDDLNPQEKEILNGFIKNENKVLIAYERINLGYSGLLDNTKIINASAYPGDLKSTDWSHYWVTSELEKSINSGSYPIGNFKQYRIKDDYFSEFKLVYEVKGKLGNFY